MKIPAPVRCGLSLFAFTLSALAQSVESIPYRAVLLTSNEVPAVNLDASGSGTVWLHIVRDASGEVVSGSVDFNVRYRFPAAVNVTAMHIHNGAAGVNGPVVIDSGITAQSDVTVGVLPALQAQVSADTAAALTAVKGILADPSQYYLNVHTSANPAGVFRGQLMRADSVVRIAMLSPANEVPPIAGLGASARGSVMLLRTTDRNGNTNSASIIFDIIYTGFPAGTAFTGYHLHAGPAGVNGPVTIDSTLSTPVDAPDSGAGFLRFESEVDLARAGALATIDSLFYAPQAIYMNLHTRANPGGAIRGQMLSTDSVSFQVDMSPANENPPVNLDVNAPAKVTVYTARGANGEPVAGAILFDINPRFGNAPATVFTNLHVHDGDAGVNGPVTLDSRFSGGPVLARNGVGNIFRFVSLAPTAIPSLASLVVNPEKHYVNLHTQANPGGAVRAQAGPAVTAAPSVVDIIAGASDPSLRTVAPGGVAAIYGANIAKASADTAGVNALRIPNSLNGTSVTVGGVDAPVLYVTPNQVNVQVPFEVQPGMQPVVVKSANGSSEAYMQMVAPAAPAILFDSVGGIVFHAADQSLVRPESPIVNGEQIAILCTGLGATLPAAPTGTVLGSDPLYLNLIQPTVTIGGRAVPILGAGAAPGFVGFNLVVTAPVTGLTSGTQQLTLRSGTVNSNSVPVAVR